MESRLTKLAETLLLSRRRQGVRILDYATPDSQETWRQQWDDLLEWCSAHPVLIVFVAGIMCVVAGANMEPHGVGHLLITGGGLLVSGSLHWWLVRRPPRW